MSPVLVRWVEWAAASIELLAVGLIAVIVLLSTLFHLVRFLRGRGETDVEQAVTRYRRRLGEALLLGLQILVAADVVRTVALDDTMKAMASLGVLVLIRTVLSWSLVVELEGRWPWQRAERST